MSADKESYKLSSPNSEENQKASQPLLEKVETVRQDTAVEVKQVENENYGDQTSPIIDKPKDRLYILGELNLFDILKLMCPFYRFKILHNIFRIFAIWYCEFIAMEYIYYSNKCNSLTYK